jgi:hypothetical protein
MHKNINTKNETKNDQKRKNKRERFAGTKAKK